MPLAFQISPNFTFSSYFNNDILIFNKAIILQIIEMFSLVIFCFWLDVKNEKKNNLGEKKLYFSEGKYVVYFFIVIGIILILLYPNVFKTISFITIKKIDGGRLGGMSLSTFDNFLREFIVLIINLVYLCFINFFAKKYQSKKAKKYIYYILVVTIINICIITGEKRSGQIYTAFACFAILLRLFPERKKMIISIIVVSCGMVVVLATIYKTFFAFNYANYSDAITNSGYNFKTFVKDLDIYLLGPITYSAVISFNDYYGQYSILFLIFDFFRSFIGLSFFVKGFSFEGSSALFNMFVTKGRTNSGYLLPITGLGYITFGYLLSPIILLFILYLAYKAELLFRKTNNLLLSYFVAFVYIRLATCFVASNINTVLVHLSTTLLFAGILIFINKIIYKLNK